MAANNQSSNPSPTIDPGELARRQQEQTARDTDELRARRAQADRDTEQHNALMAQARAQSAAGAAENAQRVADDMTAEAEGDGLEEVDFGQSRMTHRIPGGGTRTYGPGKVRVPASIADAVRNAPTFATSGDRIADSLVRRRLERDHGVTEITSTEDSTARAAFGSDTHNEGGSDDDQRDGGGRLITENVGNQPPMGTPLVSGENRAETRRQRNKPDATPLSKSALKALGAEEVERRYEAAVRAGRVKAIADGKGSGADGAVITDDRVDALADAGETE